MTTPVHDSVSAYMSDVLSAIVSTFSAAGVALPARQLVTTGQVAHDCEEVVVSFIQMYLGSPGIQAESPQPCNSPRTVVLEVSIVRQLPLTDARSTAPSAAASLSMVQTQMRDVWLLMDAGLYTVDQWAGAIADISVTNPAGGYQAVVLNLIAAVP